MAKTVALSDLRSLVRYYGDFENDTAFASNTELNARINRAIGALYDKIAEANEEYYLTFDVWTTVAGTTDYALPASFYRLLGVDLSISSTEYVSLPRFQMAERNTRRSAADATDCAYSLWGSSLRIIPAPPAGRTLRAWFIPVYTTLSGDSDTFDGVNGWEDWVALEVAIGLRIKEESDVSDLRQSQALAWDRISAAVAKRDSANPSRVIDIDAVDEDEEGFGY